jgi:hypothetical protein
LDRSVWTVVAVEQEPADEHTGHDQVVTTVLGPTAAPVLVTLRPVGEPAGERTVRCWPGWSLWWVYDTTPPMCRDCAEPLPCRHLQAARRAAAETDRAFRLGHPVHHCSPDPVAPQGLPIPGRNV